jgi:hypothetical protein
MIAQRMHATHDGIASFPFMLISASILQSPMP